MSEKPRACARAMVRYYYAVKEYAGKTVGYYSGARESKCGIYGTYSDPNPKNPGMRGVYRCVSKKEYDKNLALQKAAVKAKKEYEQNCLPIFGAINNLELSACTGPDPVLAEQICKPKK